MRYSYVPIVKNSIVNYVFPNKTTFSKSNQRLFLQS